jgi:hypothetical protein
MRTDKFWNDMLNEVNTTDPLFFASEHPDLLKDALKEVLMLRSALDSIMGATDNLADAHEAGVALGRIRTVVRENLNR